MLAVGGAVAIPLSASAAPPLVVNANDAGVGSLRAAVLGAVSGDTIIFQPGIVGPISLLSPIVLPVGLTIDGTGAPVIDRGSNAGFDQFSIQPTSGGQSYRFLNLTFANTPAGSGSSIHSNNFAVNSPLNLTFDNVEIAHQFRPLAAGAGAAIWAENTAGTVSITGSRFLNNRSDDGNGGAVHLGAVGGAVTVSGSVFSTNGSPLVATSEGGGLAVLGAAAVTVSNTRFSANTAEVGGGLFVESVASVAVGGGSLFESNQTRNAGGGAGFSSDASVALTGTTFRLNSSNGNRGGAFYTNGVTALTVAGSTFDTNSAQGGGAYGAITAPTTTTISGSTFTANSSGGGGGAIAFDDIASSAVSVTTSTFSGNSAADGGGAIFAGNLDAAGSLAVTNSTLSGNSISGPVLLAGSSIQVLSLDGRFDLDNSTISDTAPQAGQFAIGLGAVSGAVPGRVAITSSTISGPGGVLLGGPTAGTVSVRNSIVTSVTPANAAIQVTGAAPGFTVGLAYSIISDAAAGANLTNLGGNQFAVDPKLGPLANNGGPTQTRLPAADSPAINAGDPAIVGAPSNDQRGAGFARIRAGRIDIGAVEVPTTVLATSGSDSSWPTLYLGLFALFAGIALLGVDRRRGLSLR